MDNIKNTDEEKVIIPGGQRFAYRQELDKHKYSMSLHSLYFGAYQLLINQIGMHENLQLALNINIQKEHNKYTNKQNLVCKMETMHIYEQEVKYLKTTPVELFIPHRKCTLKERFKILFKGEL